MFNISRHTDYAARIVLHLATLEPGSRVTAKEVAQRRLIPPAFVRRIVSRLSSAGILKTLRGSGGGIALARPAAEISLREVVEALEGPLSLNCCVEEPKACPLSTTCPIQVTWVGATRHLSSYLEKIRFSDLAVSAGAPPSVSPAVKRGAGKRSGVRRHS